jgi:endonuclease YncB( thermonuclease family)
MPARPLALTPVLALLVGLLAVLAPSAAHAADKDCSDFNTQKDAQVFFLANGGPDSDPHQLDGSDNDGLACESLPCPCYYGTDSPTSGTSTEPKVLRQKARVVSVVDGDTVKVRLANGKRRTVRLIGIDTPEVYGGVECGGKKASASAKRMLPRGTRVTLVSDSSQDRVDRYGRLLRYVIKGDRDINKAQVRRGWATVYVYDRTPFARVTGYRIAQRRAKADLLGIWRLCR